MPPGTFESQMRPEPVCQLMSSRYYLPLQARPTPPRREDEIQNPNFPARNTNRLPLIPRALAACEPCRSKKTRCDGNRPTCGSCQRKRRDCKFLAGPGMSRYAGFKAEVARLRTTLVSHHVQVASISDAVSPKELNSGDVPCRTSTRRSQPPMPTRLNPDATSIRSQRRPASIRRSLPSPLPSPRNISITAATPRVDGTCSIPRSESSFNPLKIGDFLRQQITIVRQALGYFSNHDNFLFSTPSRSDIVAMLHQLDDIPTSLTKSQLCQLCAIVSLGAHHSRGSTPDGFEDYAYNVTKVFLDDCIEDSPSTAMKVCTLLVARNIVTKADVALTYTELGLGLSRSLGLVNDHAPVLSVDDWIELKRVRRCLLMMNFWLRMDNRRMKRRGVADVTHIWPFEEPKFQVPTGLDGRRGLFQREMANVAVLKQRMREVLSQKETLSSSFTSLRKSLDDWYNGLPIEANISSIAGIPLPSTARLELYFIHLMHLGAVLLLFRLLVQRYWPTVGPPAIPEDLVSHINDGLVAARHSVRICCLLETEAGSTRHSWILIFQGYIAGCILLHQCFQNLVAGRVSPEVKDDVVLTSRILSLLASYAKLDSIARDFLETLQYYVNLLQGHPSWQDVPSRSERSSPSPGANSSPSPGVVAQSTLLSSVSGNSAYLAASRELLELVRHPFGDLRVRPESSMCLFRVTLINHEECSLGIHHDWVCEYDDDSDHHPIESAQGIGP